MQGGLRTREMQETLSFLQELTGHTLKLGAEESQRLNASAELKGYRVLCMAVVLNRT